MPTITVNGRPVNVSESFLSLTPEQQDLTIDEIAASFEPEPEPIAPPTEGVGADFARAASAMTQNPTRARYDELPDWQ